MSNTIVSANVPPTVSVLACGGGGINMVRRALPELEGAVTHRYFDTSKANLMAGEKATIIGGGGSGLVRHTNADPVVSMVASLSDEEIGLADINILVFSLSGGSGSVIGPVLINDIAGRRKRLVIAIVIASEQSETHTKNTLKTLQSLRNVADLADLYLPIMIFNNDAGVGLVDKVLPYKLARLVDLLTKPTVEIDLNDRLNWLDVPKTLGEDATGLRLLHVTTPGENIEDSQAEIWPEAPRHVYDSIILIHTEDYSTTPRPKARSVFEGRFSTVKLVPMMGIIGNPPKAFDNLLKHIQDTLHDYQVNSSQHEDPFSTDGATKGKHKSGLIL